MKKISVFVTVVVVLLLSACAPSEPEPEKIRIDSGQLETWPDQSESESTPETSSPRATIEADADVPEDQGVIRVDQPSVAITARILDLEGGDTSTTTELRPDHTYRISIVVEAIDNFVNHEAPLGESIVEDVYFSIEIPRYIAPRDPQSELYLGGEMKLSAATNAEYAAVAGGIDNVYRDDVCLYGTERGLTIEPLACSAVEWSGLIRQDICRWIANPMLNSEGDFYLSHQVGDMYVGESRTFSLDFRVVDAETHLAARQAEPFTIKLLGAYPASKAHPGPSVTEMKRSPESIIRTPREGENYYLTFALPFPTYLKEYLDVSEISYLTDLQTLTVDQVEKKLYLSHELSANDICVDYAQFVMDLPEGFPKVTDQQSFGITPSYWSTAEIDYPRAEYNDRTGIKFAYCPYAGEIGLQSQASGFDIEGRPTRFTVTSNSSTYFQLQDDCYKNGFLYLTYRITVVDTDNPSAISTGYLESPKLSEYLLK